MRKLLQFSALLCAAAAIAGCATTGASSTAPATPGYVYVTGHQTTFGFTTPEVWRCPDQAGKGECTRVEVTEEGE
ncbi:hypothetical protein [Sorangium sp. So ce1078]|uniref:hypothetical protein n=1 Tax=unclassified Sorangium TaxID=2621164 RepID=UPI003F5EFA9A